MSFALCCSWFLRKPPQSLEEVPIPPLRGDDLHNMTVLPYLMDFHYVEDAGSGQPEYYTEHERNGECMRLKFCALNSGVRMLRNRIESNRIRSHSIRFEHESKM